MSRRITYSFCALLVLAFLMLILRNLLDYYVLDNNKLWVSYEVKMDKNDTLAVYYDEGKGFTANQHVSCIAHGNETYQVVNFPVIHAEKIAMIRIDLGTNNANFKLRNIHISNGQTRLPVLTNLDSTITNQVDTIIQHGEEFEIRVNGNDPFIVDTVKLKKLHLNFVSKQDKNKLLIFYLIFSLFSAFILIKAPGYTWYKQRINNKELLFAMLFLGYINIHFIALSTGVFENDFELEKRNPEPFPVSIDSVKVEQVNKYLTDRFALRQALTASRSKMYYTLYQKSALPDKVLVGKNKEMYSGMYFLNDDFQGKMQIDELQWKSIRKNLIERILYCQENGMHYYLFFNPNKQTVYPQFMPLPLRKLHAPSKTLLTQIRRHIERDTFLKKYVIYSNDTLLHQVKQHPNIRLFHKHDIHWNGWGAYYGYQKLMLRIHQDFPGLMPYQKKDFSVHGIWDNEGDLAMQLLLNNECRRKMFSFKLNNGLNFKKVDLTGKNSKPLYKTYVNDKKLPKLLVFRDSYFQDLIQFTSLHFSEATYIWDQEFDIEAIQESKPDIVLQEIAELFVYDLFRANPKSIQREIDK